MVGWLQGRHILQTVRWKKAAHLIVARKQTEQERGGEKGAKTHPEVSFTSLLALLKSIQLTIKVNHHVNIEEQEFLLPLGPNLL